MNYIANNNGKVWSTRDLNTLECKAVGDFTPTDIGETLGRTPGAVIRKAHDMFGSNGTHISIRFPIWKEMWRRK